MICNCSMAGTAACINCPTKQWSDDGRFPSKAFFAYGVDAVEVVRCKDCHHYFIVNQPYDEPWCSVMEDSVPTDGYCYHGRRREVTE